VLNSGLAIWFSEDGLQISYATFNDSKVEELKYPWFGTLDEGKLYPDTRTLRYPKVKTPLLDFIYHFPILFANAFMRRVATRGHSHVHISQTSFIIFSPTHQTPSSPCGWSIWPTPRTRGRPGTSSRRLRSMTSKWLKSCSMAATSD
jgi:Dipeptidyl peptidase IV (DPP IV) N-terminal region